MMLRLSHITTSCFLYITYFFFFKQKTAYDMRISDWSSVVCSSDLLVCLIGANGAGKSTTLRAICGLAPIAAGNITYDGKSIAGTPSYTLVRQGLVMVPEGRGIFGQLTIEENLAMGGYSRKDQNQVRKDIEHVFELFPRLQDRKSTRLNSSH